MVNDQSLKVCFVSQGSSYLASHRMRVAKPAELINVGVENMEAVVSHEAIPNVSVNIFNKHFSQKENFKSVKDSDKLGYYTVFDVCDDHFEREDGQYYTIMCEQADLITCNSKNMRERIKEVVGKEAFVIPDPITFPEREPVYKTHEGQVPKFIWYGHKSNSKVLVPWLDFIPTYVTCITDVFMKGSKVKHVIWRPMVVEKMIEDADIVLIPTTNHSWTKCKSPNRIVDALHSGRFVITDDVNVYEEMKDFVYYIEKPEQITEALKFWHEEPEKVKTMIEKGQKYIKEKFSDDVILNSWLEVFKNLGVIKEYE